MTIYEKLDELKKDKDYYLNEIKRIDLENQQLPIRYDNGVIRSYDNELR